MTSDIWLSGVACTTGMKPNQVVQSSSENDIDFWQGFVTTSLTSLAGKASTSLRRNEAAMAWNRGPSKLTRIDKTTQLT
jgi:hypothetical protein